MCKLNLKKVRHRDDTNLSAVVGYYAGTATIISAEYRYMADRKHPKSNIYVTWKCSRCKTVAVSDWQDFKIRKSCVCKAPLFWVSNGTVPKEIYDCFMAMHQRCSNPKNKAYKNYGGRGITVCKEWEDILVFYRDMGDKPYKKYSLDRVDNNKEYSKENCEWRSCKVQCRNRRGVSYILLSPENKEVHLQDLLKEHGLSSSKGYYQINKNLKSGVQEFLGHRITTRIIN